MSYTTIFQAASDPELLHRIEAATQKEALNNPIYGDTPFGQEIQKGGGMGTSIFRYPVAVATEAAYEYAINASNPSPGGDPTVITDADILSVIQVNWPDLPHEVVPA